MREHEITSSEMLETARIEDYEIQGPRPSTFSFMPEVKSMVMHSFKNCDATSWRHIHDILMPSCVLPTGLMSELRRAIAVSRLCL